MYPDSSGSPDSRDCHRLLHGTTADDPFLTVFANEMMDLILLQSEALIV